MTPPPAFAPPAATLGVRLAHDVLVRDDGRLLCGGTPFRLVRLTASGAEIVDRWRHGGTVGEAPAGRQLARRLLDHGLLTSISMPAATVPEAIVVPVRDRVEELDRCLEALSRFHPDGELVVVDDCSEAETEIAATATTHGARLVRHSVPLGAAAARNTGLEATMSDLVAFVDSDVVVSAGCLGRLAAHFSDPAVGAAAPRVHALARPATWIARYEAARSSLDMGERSTTVGPGHRVSYVPSTTLLVRRQAMPAGGFDPSLEFGEDVDLVWRMQADGWRVVYDAEASVQHDHRTRPGAFWRRRFDYARSIGPLAQRHPEALSPIHLDAWGGALIVLGLRAPGSALALITLRILELRRLVRPHSPHPAQLAGVLAARWLAGTGSGLSHALRRAWSPALLVGAVVTRRPRALAPLAGAFVTHGFMHARRRPVDWFLLMGDDLTAATGTWLACIECRVATPLLPRIERGNARAVDGGKVPR